MLDRRYKRKPYRRQLRLLSVALGLVALSPAHLHSAAVVFGQNPSLEKVRMVLKGGAGFSEEDLDSLEKGNVVIKKLDVEQKREVAFCGALKLDAPRDVVVGAFRRAIERQQKEVSEEYGVFRKPPDIGDLARLTIKDSEIQSLKECKPGDCKWSLSADVINRFTKEFDWSAPKPGERGSALVKQVLVDNVKAYLQGGDKALMVYNDDPEPLSVADEMSSLLDKLLWINDFAPEFTGYLNGFPNVQLDGIEDEAMWAKIKVGFKPVIINTHTIFYKKDSDGSPQCLIVSKQIYANHYFNSSLSLTGIISFPNTDGSFSTYVFFTSHSRSGALTGTMGKFARVAIDGEAESKLTNVLNDTKRYAAYGMKASDPPAEDETGILSGIVRSIYVWMAVLLAVIGAGGWFVFRRRGA